MSGIRGDPFECMVTGCVKGSELKEVPGFFGFLCKYHWILYDLTTGSGLISYMPEMCLKAMAHVVFLWRYPENIAWRIYMRFYMRFYELQFALTDLSELFDR